ncbi:cob(II)yrinic acid a,c-diamide reductase (BluB-like) protein [Cupriavidus sp. HMR-1]|uniref:5,6-dimethylbenzimidazole synthase n=1 Tax=Cupriavidus sp. HMR-1 TaxID=1249621 RepID=UPI0002A3BE44|nr:5,6-dimethylbenzimidazole synthase [Cupriavidus sp. HMR-1]ELA01029.1 cob(II)yrinic acid a,c-diamide reductase (BluB-like) protein [Cupriavidus sp. HMR-1]
MSGPHVEASEREALYRIMALRRDCRHFTPGPLLGDEQLERLLDAAHQAPSVGLMQPWRFMRLSTPSWRERLIPFVEAERQATAQALGERAAEFLRIKVEGIRDCAELLAVVLAPDDGTVFGRRSMPREMAWASAACAVQNLWLAARAENLGLGWVSMFDPEALARELQLPEGATPFGLLCLGPVPAFYEKPMLEQIGWRQRRPLQEMLWASPDLPPASGSGSGSGGGEQVGGD